MFRASFVMIKEMKNSFKNDQFKNARGNYSRLLKLSCDKCDSFVCNYQKDGPGNLRRLYIDRISNPAIKISGTKLMCECGHLLGIKIIYKKEDRPAYRLFVDAVNKKIIKS